MTYTVYPKKYAHGFCFAVLCCGYTLTDFPISIRLTSLALWQSSDCPSASKATLMNMDKYFMWIQYERLHNHNKAKHNKTVCIFLGIYCSINWYRHKLEVWRSSYMDNDIFIILTVLLYKKCFIAIIKIWNGYFYRPGCNKKKLDLCHVGDTLLMDSLCNSQSYQLTLQFCKCNFVVLLSSEHTFSVTHSLLYVSCLQWFDLLSNINR